MSLTEKINNDIKEAMKSRDDKKLAALRAVKAEILILNTSGQSVSEEAEMKMLQKMVKQRQESAALYEEQNRMDLAEPEIYQADIIGAYLPKQLSNDELTSEVKAVIDSLGASGLKDMGKVMGAATQKLTGKASGKAISDKVRELLA